MNNSEIPSIKVLKEHVDTRVTRDRAAASGDVEAFSAARRRVREADRAYRADLVSRGFPAPCGLGVQ